MTSTHHTPAHPDVSVRQAALVAATSLLVMSVLSPLAYFYIFPKLVVRTDIVQTIQNITAHLGMLAYLVYRSGYIPRLLGVLLAINSAGYLVATLRPYLFPETTVPYLFVAFFGELIFMSWLFFRGSGLQDPPSAGAVSAPRGRPASARRTSGGIRSIVAERA